MVLLSTVVVFVVTLKFEGDGLCWTGGLLWSSSSAPGYRPRCCLSAGSQLIELYLCLKFLLDHIGFQPETLAGQSALRIGNLTRCEVVRLREGDLLAALITTRGPKNTQGRLGRGLRRTA